MVSVTLRSRWFSAAFHAGLWLLLLLVVIGIIERAGGTLYCTGLYLDGARGLVATHRKLMPTALERMIWGFGDGSTLTAVDSPYGPIGAVICW